ARTPDRAPARTRHRGPGRDGGAPDHVAARRGRRGRGGGGRPPPRPLEDGDGMKDEALAARCRRLRLVLTDVDGVMTDGTVLLLPGGGEAKAFHVRDGLGVMLARRAGLPVGILSSRTSEVVAQRAKELGMAPVRQ